MVTLCILNHNGKDVLPEALRAAQRLDAQVVVVDNASTDGSERLAVETGVEVWHADNAAQFITGLNTAFTRAQTGWVLFQQNDVQLDPGALEALHRAVAWCGLGAIYQPVLYNLDGSVNHAGVHYDWPGVGLGYATVQDTLRPYPVPVFSTACFFMHRTIYEELGAFDVALAPAYYEDVDYSLRAARHGIPRYVVPHATGVHRSTFTFHRTHSTTQLSAVCRRNRRYVVQKHFHGMDRRLRLIALACLPRLTGGRRLWHGDTYRSPTCRDRCQPPLGLA